MKGPDLVNKELDAEPRAQPASRCSSEIPPPSQSLIMARELLDAVGHTCDLAPVVSDDVLGVGQVVPQ